MAIIFQDTFTEAGSDTLLQNHTPDTGTSWTIVIDSVADNDLEVESTGNYLKCDSASSKDGMLYTADVTYPSANYTVEVDNTNVDTLDDYQILAARIQDANNMYVLEWLNDRFILYKRVAGSWTTLDTAVSPSVIDGDTIKLEVIGTAIKGYINDVEKVSATDASHSAAGKAGIGVGDIVTTGGDMSSQNYDNFIVTDLGAAGTNLQINIGDAWKEVPAAHINIGDAWKDVASASVNIGDAWKTIF